MKYCRNELLSVCMVSTHSGRQLFVKSLISSMSNTVTTQLINVKFTFAILDNTELS